jgi:hypothetical protein
VLGGDYNNSHYCNGSGSLADRSDFGQAPGWVATAGRDLLENGDFPRFILPFCAHKTPLLR